MLDKDVMAICDRQRCNRTADVAPRLTVPRFVGAKPDPRLDYAMMLGAKLCRRCCLQLVAKNQVMLPNIWEAVVQAAIARAQKMRRPYEEPDFARAKIECVKLASPEYKLVATQLEERP
jgi:hypothetical protein